MFTEIKEVCWEFEDNLEIDIIDGMFIVSKIIDGVRMYPFISVDFGRYYLEGKIN